MGKTQNRNRVKQRVLGRVATVDTAELDALSAKLKKTLRNLRQECNIRIDLLQRQRRTAEDAARAAYERERREILERVPTDG